jgi:hypothetical protein
MLYIVFLAPLTSFEMTKLFVEHETEYLLQLVVSLYIFLTNKSNFFAVRNV